MAYQLETKEKAIELRERGYSLKEIAAALNIAKSTASFWLSDLELNEQAIARLKKRRQLGRYNSMVTKKRKRKEAQERLNKIIDKELVNLKFNEILYKLICATLFWAEGSKTNSHVRFTNSDPKMIETFINTFRKAYALDESKFRALVHIHEYHNNEELKKYWSRVTGIPLKQFHRSYKKTHTGKRKKENYQGCISINYYDSKIAKELHTLYNRLAKKL